ncbi:MAG TPA: NUDIX hydrolase, partial [Ktedonobacterales bacterium]|nr:NUDIX hydrolase [Ktedonobacterales bacterium]
MGEQAQNDVIYQGSALRLRVETVPHPQGGVTRYEIVDHPGAVAIVALRQPQQGNEPLVALVRQRRPAIGADTWELPAGLIDPRDQGDPLRAAQRELREETGYIAADWRPLAHEYSSPGFTNEVISLFLALDVRPMSGADAGQPEDSSEIAQVRWEPLDSALTLALTRSQSGAIADGKTLLGLSLARDLWRQRAQNTTPTTPPSGGDTMPRDVTNMPFARNAPYAQEMRERG